MTGTQKSSFSITKLGKIEFLKIRTNRGLSVLQPMNTTSLFVSNHFMNLVLRYFMFDSGDSIEDVHQSLRDIFCTLCAKCQAIFFVISKTLKAAKSLPIGRSPTEMPSLKSRKEWEEITKAASKVDL